MVPRTWLGSVQPAPKDTRRFAITGAFGSVTVAGADALPPPPPLPHATPRNSSGRRPRLRSALVLIALVLSGSRTHSRSCRLVNPRFARRASAPDGTEAGRERC